MTVGEDGGRTSAPSRLAVNGYVGLVIVVGVAVAAAGAWTQRVDSTDLRTFAVLSALAVSYDLFARRVELIRRRTASGPYVMMDSVWVIAAAVNLPIVLVAGVIALTQAHQEYQGRRIGNGKPVARVAFNTAAALLPAAAVATLVDRTGALDVRGTGSAAMTAPLVVAVAVVAFAALNTAIVGIVIALSSGERRLRNLVGTATENLVEFATLTLGVLVGVAMTFDIWLALLSVPILVLLQRIALVDHLESAASEDAKTGLLNTAAWNHLVDRDLERAKARSVPAAVMVVDLDHFKRVNDTYGHLTGDAVLRSVAECMRGMLRDRDQVARFGGEEFVAFLPGADASEACKVAERLRQRIEAMRVAPVAPRVVGPAGAPLDSEASSVRESVRITVSIGVAAHPEHGDALEDLLARADAALYEAKNDGRNRIRTAA
ncbi:diguanylate cyclase [Jatrophihabitans sp. YIM 134969]